MMAAGRGLGWKLEGSGVNSGKGEKKKKKSFHHRLKNDISNGIELVSYGGRTKVWYVWFTEKQEWDTIRILI